jgi:hypothetical protein
VKLASLRPTLSRFTLLFTVSAASAPLLLAPHAASAQQPAPPAGIQIDAPQEIQIDRDCRIMTLDLRNPTHPKPHFRTDLALCHLESEHDSEHWEKAMKNGVPKDVLVRVREHEFVLQNPYAQAVTYIVHQPISKHYRIDSDPRPDAITAPTDGSQAIAIFRVAVAPGQTARLHVGERD